MNRNKKMRKLQFEYSDVESFEQDRKGVLETLCLQESRIELIGALKRIPKSYRDLINKLYGLDGELNPPSFSELARELGVKRQAVWRKHQAALRSLAGVIHEH